MVNGNQLEAYLHNFMNICILKTEIIDFIHKLLTIYRTSCIFIPIN
ncbi:hypothetical protein LFUMFP_130009 [Latilactobacillus fuchuensis]|uniref:Uncharacterized protein n=1 Tax=Latilactobacillus fuchuensis TaxID=164393 RepID=A0A2N9DTI4_9LACO|nr:hypothetical protein LFUMFP_130009 [Latilactobacillus fuchuensis]